jgi:dipicolinate synthase subunit A
MILTTIDGKWLFIGTDRRLSECSRIMKQQGSNVFHYEGNNYSDHLSEILDEFSPTHIVFPILQMEGTIPVSKINKDVILYTGMAADDWLAPFKEAGITIRPYLKEVEFVWENAVLTAEGFLIEYYSSAKRRISGEHFYIAGFGKVGKATAAVLSSLGASITILARSRDQLGEAAANGYGTMLLPNDALHVTGILVNTIPAKWLQVGTGFTLRIYDLASAPGCLRDNAPDEYYTIHLGLPGKHFPADAAKALSEALLRMNSR